MEPLPLFGGDLSKSESHTAESFSGKGSLMMTLAGFLDRLDAAVVGFLDGLDGAVMGGSRVEGDVTPAVLQPLLRPL